MVNAMDTVTASTPELVADLEHRTIGANIQVQGITRYNCASLYLILSKMLLGMMEVRIEHLRGYSKTREHLHTKVPKIVMTPKYSAHQDQ
jgi:hypothetical protein